MKTRNNIFIFLFLCLVTFFHGVYATDEAENNALPTPDDDVLFSVTEKDISFDIVGFSFKPLDQKRENGNLYVNYCFTAVDDGEWYIIPKLSMIGDKEIIARTFEYGEKIPATGEEPGKICVQLRYDNANISTDDTVSLAIRELYAVPREGSPCKDILHRYRTNSKAQKLNVELSCSENFENDIIRSTKDYILDIDSYDELKGSPADLLKEIEEILSPHIEGNWTFHIENLSKYIE